MQTIADYGVWLSENCARKTQLSYAAAVVGYLRILDSLGHWPPHLTSIKDVRQNLHQKNAQMDDEQEAQQTPYPGFRPIAT
jgi:hypothetical protein